MPRRSAADSAVTRPELRLSRLQPPSSLTEVERGIFLELVNNNAPEHFQKSDRPLLVTYVKACAMCDLATANMNLDGHVVGGRVSPWLTVMEKANRIQVALSMRLRLSPQARAPNRPGRAGKPPVGSSYYETIGE